MDKISQKVIVLEAINYDIHDQNYVHDIAQCEIIFCCFLVKNAKKILKIFYCCKVLHFIIIFTNNKTINTITGIFKVFIELKTRGKRPHIKNTLCDKARKAGKNK